MIDALFLRLALLLPQLLATPWPAVAVLAPALLAHPPAIIGAVADAWAIALFNSHPAKDCC